MLKRVANISPQPHLSEVFWQSLNMKYERSEEKVGTVRNVLLFFFPTLEIEFFIFFLFSIPKKTKDLFEGQQPGFWERDFRRKERE